MKEKNNYKGITLIALVITIIVLLILAGVSIATLTGDNGVLTQASRSNEETRAGEVEEEVNLWKSQKNGSNYIYWETEEEDELLDRLKNTGKIVEDEINRTNKTITIGDRVISYKIPITLADGELGLDYEIVDNSLLLLYPKMGGYMTYQEYARDILSKKTYDEKIDIFLQIESNNVGHEFKNLEEWIVYFNNAEGTNFSEENFEKEIVEYFKENGYIAYSNIISNTIDDLIIDWGYIDRKEYDKKYKKYYEYGVKILEDEENILEYHLPLGYFTTTPVKAGTHIYTAVGTDGQGDSITLTFREDELPRYVIELRENYIFDIYDNKEQKYITFDNAILELKRDEQEIFNNDVTKKIETEKRSDDNEEDYYDYSYFELRYELSDLISSLEILDAKIIIDGEEIQNKVCMPTWPL